MKKILIISSIILLLIILVIIKYFFNSKIDYSCEIDSDCEIKNVGNECGYYPKCVNKNFKPNPPELKSSDCGFPLIDHCKCINNQCVERYD
ncbi:MAG: hypothetical protein ACOCUU_02625 [Nanoarchaeota archaeon]